MKGCRNEIRHASSSRSLLKTTSNRSFSNRQPMIPVMYETEYREINSEINNLNSMMNDMLSDINKHNNALRVEKLR